MANPLHHQGWVQLIPQDRERVELGVHPGHPGAELGTRGDTGDGPKHRDHQSPLDVVPRNLAVGVAERLDGRDLLAFEGYRSREDNVEKESGHREEQDRHHLAHGVQAVQLGLQKEVRGLQRSRDRAGAAVRFEQAVQASNHRLGFGPVLQGDEYVVESALHVECGGQRVGVHPQHAVQLLVGDDLAGANGVHELGRQGEADDL